MIRQHCGRCFAVASGDSDDFGIGEMRRKFDFGNDRYVFFSSVV